MSLSQGSIIRGSSGDLVCRSPRFADVVKFFLLNYGLHTLTVIYPPGHTNELIFLEMMRAFFHPMFGILSAISPLRTRAVFVKDKLQRAHCAGALWMLVPWELNEQLG